MRPKSTDDDICLRVARIRDEEIHELLAFEVAGSRFAVRGPKVRLSLRLKKRLVEGTLTLNP